MKKETLLHVQDLTVLCNQQQLLKAISFDVEKGEIIAFVGESGSGKSLTAFSLVQLLDKSLIIDSRSKIVFKKTLLTGEGINWTNIRGKQIGFIFQDPQTALNPVLTCGAQIAETIQAHQKCSKNIAETKAKEWLLKVQLHEVERIYKSYPHQLSGGQKQRICIAIALCNNPDLIIADEPTTALDAVIQHEIIELLLQLQQQLQTTLLFITHDISLVEKHADKILLFKNGEIIEQIHRSNFSHNYQSKYYQQLLQSKQSLKQYDYYLPTKQDENPEKKPPSIIHPERILVAKNVSFAFENSIFSITKKKSAILKDINVELRKGETLGIIGESGSGKTTLGRLLAGLLPIDKGDILFENKQITECKNPDQRKYIRRNIQYVFQDPYASLQPRMIVGEAIQDVLLNYNLVQNKKQAYEKTMSLLNEMQLNASFYHRYPHQLSGGQRQRIAIARSLAAEPSVIIFDECTSALDVIVQAEILNLLNRMKYTRGLSYIFITHNMPVVQYFSDRIAVMQNGEIVDIIEKNEIENERRNTYTQKLFQTAY